MDSVWSRKAESKGSGSVGKGRRTSVESEGKHRAWKGWLHCSEGRVWTRGHHGAASQWGRIKLGPIQNRKGLGSSGLGGVGRARAEREGSRVPLPSGEG